MFNLIHATQTEPNEWPACGQCGDDLNDDYDCCNIDCIKNPNYEAPDAQTHHGCGQRYEWVNTTQGQQRHCERCDVWPDEADTTLPISAHVDNYIDMADHLQLLMKGVA